MKKLFILLNLGLCCCLFGGCNVNPSKTDAYDDVQLDEIGETTAPLWWYDAEQDVFHDVDTVKQDMTITVNLPKDCKLFYVSENRLVNVIAKCNQAEIPEMSYFTAYGFDENDLHLANNHDWRNWAAGDSCLTGDFVLTLWYGEHRVIINGKVR